MPYICHAAFFMPILHDAADDISPLLPRDDMLIIYADMPAAYA